MARRTVTELGLQNESRISKSFYIMAILKFILLFGLLNFLVELYEAILQIKKQKYTITE